MLPSDKILAPVIPTTLNGIIDQEFPAGVPKGSPVPEFKTGYKVDTRLDVDPSGFCIVQVKLNGVPTEISLTLINNKPLLFFDKEPPTYFFIFL